MFISERIGDEYQKWRNGDVVLLTAPTGTGKTTFIFETLLPYIMQNRRRVLYLVNRKVLWKQLQVELDKIKSRYLLNESGVNSIERYIQIETYQQFEKKIISSSIPQAVGELSGYSYIVYDECHYFYSDSSFNTYTELSYDFFRLAFTNTIQIFMSATMDNMQVFIEKRYFTLPNRLPYVSKYNIIKYDMPCDYSYINLGYFTSQKEMINVIADSDTDKWLIFTDSIDAGRDLYDELNGIFGKKKEVGYIDAKYKDDEEGKAIVDDIAKDNFTKKRILIATAVIDNGISIKDRELQNIVIMADTKESFIQMLGRRRPDGVKVNLYIFKRDGEYFGKRLRYVNQILTFYDAQAVKLNQIFQDYYNNGYVFPLVKCHALEQQNFPYTQKAYSKEHTDEKRNNNISDPLNQPVIIPWYMQQTIMEKILSDTRIYEYAKKLLYPINGVYAVNSFSLRRFRQLQVFYMDIMNALSEDADAFIKVQAEWLGFGKEEVSMCIQASKEELDEMHRMEIVDILTSKKYIENDLTREQNKKMLKVDLCPSFLYFVQNADCIEKEDKARLKNVEKYLGQNDRPISKKDFNLFMKLADLPYEMTKKGGSIFFIKRVE